MNCVQMKEYVDFLMNRSRSSRFTFNQYNIAFNAVIASFFDLNKKDEINVRENLYTLLKTTTPVITTTLTTSTYTQNHFAKPTDFNYFSSLSFFVDGVSADVYPMDNNQKVVWLNDTFKAPTNDKVYQWPDATGFNIYRGVGGTPTASFTYLRLPAQFYLGNESDLITDGGTLVVSNNYTAIEESVESGVTYNPGDTFNAASAVLTSGQVILTSIQVNCDLPEEQHQEICKLTASYLSGSTSDFNKSSYTEKIFTQTEK